MLSPQQNYNIIALNIHSTPSENAEIIIYVMNTRRRPPSFAPCASPGSGFNHDLLNKHLTYFIHTYVLVCVCVCEFRHSVIPILYINFTFIIIITIIVVVLFLFSVH